MLTFFYGHPKTNKRLEGYNILRHMNNLHPYMWLCIGDFNEVLFHSEKYGGAQRSNKQIAMFHDVLHDCQLDDLGFHKGQFTWSNNRIDCTFTKERLNRALASTSWYSESGDAKV